MLQKLKTITKNNKIKLLSKIRFFFLRFMNFGTQIDSYSHEGVVSLEMCPDLFSVDNFS